MHPKGKYCNKECRNKEYKKKCFGLSDKQVNQYQQDSHGDKKMFSIKFGKYVKYHREKHVIPISYRKSIS